MTLKVHEGGELVTSDRLEMPYHLIVYDGIEIAVTYFVRCPTVLMAVLWFTLCWQFGYKKTYVCEHLLTFIL